MPLLPLPIGGTAIGAGDLPVVDTDSIAALEPLMVKESDSAPVRDAIRAALTAMFTYYQDQIAESAMQSSVLYATGQYLDGLGRDEGVFRQDDEPYTSAGDAAYRARIITQGGTVTPDVICAAVNSILAPYSDIPCRYLESMLDRGFCRDDTTTGYVAYLRDGTVVGNIDPTYVDRLYINDAASNEGVSITNRGPGGFFCFADTIGRFFVLRIPVLALLDSDGAFASDGTADWNAAVNFNFGLFCRDDSLPLSATIAWSFFRDAPATSTAVYQSIVNTVNRLVGHSIRWVLLPDPLLV